MARSLLDLRDELGKLLNNAGQTAGNVVNYFNPSVGVNVAPPTMQNPVGPTQVQTPQIRSFWTDTKLNSPYVGDLLFNWLPQRPDIIKNAPVLGGLTDMAGNMAKDVINSPQKLVISGLQGQKQMAQNALAMTGLVKPVPVQEQLGTMGEFGNAALNLLPFLKVGEVPNLVKNLGELGAKEAIGGAGIVGARTGMVWGGVQGFLNGLDKNRNKTLGEQLKSAGFEGLQGAGTGFVVGGAAGLAGGAFGQWLKKKPMEIYDEISNIRPNASPAEKSFLTKEYTRDKLGQFAPAFNKGEYWQAGNYPPLTDTERAALNKRFGFGNEGFARIPGQPQADSINKYLTNAYKVYSGQKPEQVVANLAEDVAKNTNLPRDIVVKKAFFDHISERHPELNKQQLFSFVKTLNIPDEIYQVSKENRLNFFRQLEDKTINTVSTGKDWVNPRQNVITSFNATDSKELKYVQKIKNTSNKVFPINSGGAGNSSSDMLSQVPGAGARLPRSSESTGSISPSVNLKQDLEDFLNGKVNDVVNSKFMSSTPPPLNQGANQMTQVDPLALKQLKYQPESKIGVNQSNMDIPTFMREANNPQTNGTANPLGVKTANPELAGQATKVEGKLGQAVRPQTMTGGGQQNSSSNQNIDPVQKIINALQGAKPIRNEQEAIYRKIRSQQAGALVGIGGQMKGEAGFFQKKAQLKGEMPKVSFESIKKQFTQPELDSLYNKIEQANITPFEKVTAQSGLAKLLGAEGGVIPNNSELSLLNEIFPKEFTDAVLSKRSMTEKLFANVQDALNIPRAVMATADMSAPLRQGAFLVGRPKQWLPAFGNMFKYAFNPKSYDGLLEQIASRPTYQLMRENKLAITNTKSILNQHEETFMSNLVGKIPVFGSITRGSERAYSGFLNKLRADTFDSLVNSAKSQGLDVNTIAPDIARFVNSATGRGELPGSLQRASVALNGLMFSPRLLASRINLMNPQYYMSLNPFVRKEALKSLATFAGTALSVLSLAKLGGEDVGADPRSADFGKIKFGNTRYDILAGFQQPIRLMAQLISGKIISTTTGKEITLGEGYKPMTRKDIVANFLQSKESPTVGFALGLLQGQNNIGQTFDVAPEAVSRFIPMIVQDMYDIAKDRNSPLAALMGIPGVFGAGVQTYGKQVANLETTPTGKPTIKLSPLPGLPEDIVNKITGKQPSNIPENLQSQVVSSIQSDKQKKVDMDRVKQMAEAGKLQQVGNYTPVIVNGEVKVIDMSFKPTLPKMTGNQELDKKAVRDYKGEITKKSNDIYDLYKGGVITAEVANKQLSDLKNQGSQFNAPKKPKKIASKSIKVSLPKKSTMFKLAKAPTLKGLKVKGQSNRRFSIKA